MEENQDVWPMHRKRSYSRESHKRRKETHAGDPLISTWQSVLCFSVTCLRLHGFRDNFLHPHNGHSVGARLTQKGTLVLCPCLQMDLARPARGWCQCLKDIKVEASGEPTLPPRPGLSVLRQLCLRCPVSSLPALPI